MDETYDLALLAGSRAKWERSPALRAAYQDIYGSMTRWAGQGPALEIGAGCGTMRDFHPDVVASDVRQTQYVSVIASAYSLESSRGAAAWGTIYGLDVLHHLRAPFRFFESASRALVPGGRVVLCEPAATTAARLIYGLCHQEPTDPARIRPPYEFEADDANGSFANMGMGWALFVRDREAVEARLSAMGLSVSSIEFRDVLAYASTGGFSGKAWLPAAVVRALLAVERRLPACLLRRLGLRMIIVVEKERRGAA